MKVWNKGTDGKWELWLSDNVPDCTLSYDAYTGFKVRAYGCYDTKLNADCLADAKKEAENWMKIQIKALIRSHETVIQRNKAKLEALEADS